MASVVAEREEAREVLEEAEDRYRKNMVAIDAKADELNELAAILAGVHLSPEHVNCKASMAEARAND